jgi:O-antigen/teichoic acid export membrane protein
MQLIWGIVPLTVSILWALYSFLHGDVIVGIGLIIVGITSPVLNAFNTFGAFLHGRKKFKESFFYNAVISLSYYGGMFLGIYFLRSELILAVINLVINAAVTVAMYLYTIKKYKLNTNTEPDTLEYGKRISIMNTFNGVLGQIDNVFVYSLLGPTAFAVYNLASNIPDKIGGVFRNLSSISLPRFSNRSPLELQQTLNKKIFLTLLGGGAVVFIYIVFAPLCFKILFPKYVEGVFYSQIYSISIMFGAASSITSSVLISQKNKKEYYIIETISPVVMTALQFVMVFFYGLIGIVIARTLGSIFKLVLSTILILKEKHLNTRVNI